MAFTNNIYCIGRNYQDHIAELKNERPQTPVVFLKSSIAHKHVSSSASLAFADESFHHEVEVVAKASRDFQINEQVEWSDIDDFALGLDITPREVQTGLKEAGLPWTLAKSFVGSAIVTDFTSLQHEDDKRKINFSLEVDGVVRQQGCVSDMIWSIPELMTYLNTFSPLKENDLVFTGTPKGVGPIKCGQSYTLQSSQLGKYSGIL